MGEALITRRGGGSVKTGTIKNVTVTTLQDDALIGADTAFITQTAECFAASSTVYMPVAITIINGSIKGINCTRRESSSSKHMYFTTYGVFDKDTGTITVSPDTIGLLSNASYSYDYVVVK